MINLHHRKGLQKLGSQLKGLETVKKGKRGGDEKCRVSSQRSPRSGAIAGAVEEPEEVTGKTI